MLIAVLVVLLALFASPRAQAASGLATALVPVASDQVVVDRVPMTLHRYRSRLAPERVLALWAQGAAGGPPPRDLAGGWRVASRLDGSLQETLQVRADRAAGGSEVLLSRVELRAPLAALARPPLTLPAGSTVLRTLTFDDATGRASQFIVSLPGGPQRAMAQLCPRLLERGWQPAGKASCAARAIATTEWFLRGAETLGLALHARGAGTRAVIGYLEPRQ
ncbi:MAG: hypothetical protein AB7P31_06690 [Steroidobacteraceae bacterium]